MAKCWRRLGCVLSRAPLFQAPADWAMGAGKDEVAGWLSGFSLMASRLKASLLNGSTGPPLPPCRPHLLRAQLSELIVLAPLSSAVVGTIFASCTPPQALDIFSPLPHPCCEPPSTTTLACAVARILPSLWARSLGTSSYERKLGRSSGDGAHWWGRQVPPPDPSPRRNDKESEPRQK